MLANYATMIISVIRNVITWIKTYFSKPILSPLAKVYVGIVDAKFSGILQFLSNESQPKIT